MGVPLNLALSSFLQLPLYLTQKDPLSMSQQNCIAEVDPMHKEVNHLAL